MLQIGFAYLEEHFDGKYGGKEREKQQAVVECHGVAVTSFPGKLSGYYSARKAFPQC